MFCGACSVIDLPLQVCKDGGRGLGGDYRNAARPDAEPLAWAHIDALSRGSACRFRDEAAHQGTEPIVRKLLDEEMPC